MPEFKVGDMWKAPPPDIYCVTTNACLNYAGHLVMGWGNAAQAARKYPGLAEAFGKQITVKPNHKVGSDYYLLDPGFVMKPMVLAFQTKRHWLDKSPLDLIETSLRFLGVYALGWETGAGRPPRIYLPAPGTGAGKLTHLEIYPLLKYLPDNYTVWSLG